MLFSLGHGSRVFVDDGGLDAGDAGERAGQAGTTAMPLRRGSPTAARKAGGLDYLIRNAPDTAECGVTVAELDDLAASMASDDDVGICVRSSSIPPILTYLAQFLEHDVVAVADQGAAEALRAEADCVPLPRPIVVACLDNLRFGSLSLDSLYGERSGSGAFARRLATALRLAGDPAKMRLGTAILQEPHPRVPMPADGGADLLRLGALLTDASPEVTAENLRGLQEPLRSAFVDGGGSPRLQRAIVADARNDENLIIAQLHLAFLRFHNSVVDACDDHAALAGGRNAVFEWARKQVQFVYQWLILNRFLPDICDPRTVRRTLAAGAPLYAGFIAGRTAGRSLVPLEFAVAACRFHDSMVCSAYDYNRLFGRAAGGTVPVLPRASLPLLRAFTGAGTSRPMCWPDSGMAFERLPADWSIEWDRFALAPTTGEPDRSALKIDTCLTPALGPTDSEHGLSRAALHLRRGHRLNLPSGQACVAALNQAVGAGIRPLSADELRAGTTGSAMSRTLVEHTPLWFYVLKEAEIRGGGEHLGPLGSHLVAQTVAGLVISDRNSYWHRRGSDGGRWHPADGVRPAGEVVDSLQALLRAALLL